MAILHLLLIFVAAVVVTSAPVQKTVCEGKLDTISCNGGLIIQLNSVFFGRATNSLCNPYSMAYQNLPCASTTSTSAVTSNCQGRTTCLLMANNAAMGGDPCSSTPKYLTVSYECVTSLSSQTTPAPRTTRQTPTTTRPTTRLTTPTTTTTVTPRSTTTTTKSSPRIQYRATNNSNTQVCHEYLVSGPRGVPDSQLSASSQLSISNHAHRGRLHMGIQKYSSSYTAEGGWTAAPGDAKPWIQVKMNWLTLVTGIVTQGRHVNPGTGCCQEWTTRYSVDYSIDGVHWDTVKDDTGADKVFIGNSDTDTPISQTLDCPVVARFVRVHVLNYQGRASMRLELMGCPTNTDDLGTCPKGWKAWVGSNKCYYISDTSDKRTWEDAYLMCKRHQGDILKIDSIQEKAWLRGELMQLQSSQNLNQWWTGLNNLPRYDNNYYKWDDGTSLNTNVVHWSPGEPNNVGGVEHCGSYALLSDSMNDLDCRIQQPFICEAPQYWKKPVNVLALNTQKPTLPPSLIPVTVANKVPIPIMVPVTSGPNSFTTGCMKTGDCAGRAWADYQSCNGCGFYLTCAPFGPVLRKCPFNTKYDDVTGACEQKSSTCIGP